MTITSANPLCDESWDVRLEAFADASFFHRTAWLRVLHEAYGFTPLYILGTDTDRKNAMLPMMEVSSWLTGKRGVSLPFTDECAPLGGHESELFDAAVTIGRRRHWRRIELRSGSSILSSAQPSVGFYGHRLQLQSHDPSVSTRSSEIFAKCDASTRRAVRKAEQGGIQVEFSRSLEAIRIFYGLLRKTRQRHGVPPQPFSFFRKLHQHALAAGHGWIVLARSKGVPVAGAVFLHTRRDAIYKYGASDGRYQHLRANNLVMWRAIEWYAQNNFNSLDFGRTSFGNEGLRRFKLGWGTAERMVHYFQYNFRTNCFDVGHDGASGWHTRVFRRLPCWASQLIGAVLYKHTA